MIHRQIATSIGGAAPLRTPHASEHSNIPALATILLIVQDNGSLENIMATRGDFRWAAVYSSKTAKYSLHLDG
jgi:hypothetical protein